MTRAPLLDLVRFVVEVLRDLLPGILAVWARAREREADRLTLVARLADARADAATAESAILAGLPAGRRALLDAAVRRARSRRDARPR